MDKPATVAAYTSGAGALWFGMTANEWAAIIGAGVAIATFGVNLWFKHKHYQLVKEATLRGKPPPMED